MTENAWVSAAIHWRETVQEVTAAGRIAAWDERCSIPVCAERPRGAINLDTAVVPLRIREKGLNNPQ